MCDVEPNDPPVRIALSKVANEVINPLKCQVWDQHVSREDVKCALAEGRREPRRYDDVSGVEYDHAARIAYLIENPSDYPILIGINSILCDSPMILDGNHRIAAAIYRGDTDILVDYDGYSEGFHNWLNYNGRQNRNHR